jgi:predicted nucleic acid-binding protein
VLVDADETLVDLAVDLTKRQKLRGYDAIQLVAALTLNDLLMQASLAPLTFICADEDLVRSAQGEGLATDNPNLHP